MTVELNAPQIIPVALDNPLWRQRITLDGVNYIMRFDYNQREERWYMSLYSDAGAALALGVKVVCNFPLLMRYAGREGYPQGMIVAIDLSGERGRSPTLAELGRRVKLHYITAVKDTPINTDALLGGGGGDEE